MGTNHTGTGHGPVVNRIENTVLVTGLLIQCGDLNTVTGDEDTDDDVALVGGQDPQTR
ncbi:hypothetical protein ABTZ03_30885 [Kitasatospora sp. NPDC096077]|uniref:hypothetical protein n=1 Tax=Kitasatospora sp. NPDC096077 TaxID=3155544 RepID=UPI00332CA517